MRDTDDVALTICDLELKSKGELLNYQCEYLALVFVLTLKSTSTIRVMKNLQVCGNCHSAF